MAKLGDQKLDPPQVAFNSLSEHSPSALGFDTGWEEKCFSLIELSHVAAKQLCIYI